MVLWLCDHEENAAYRAEPSFSEKPWKGIFITHFQLPKAFTDLQGLSSPTAGYPQFQADINQVHKYIFMGAAHTFNLFPLLPSASPLPKPPPHQ